MTVTSVSYLADLLPIVGESMTTVKVNNGATTRYFAVEIGLPTFGGSVLGTFILGTSVLSGLSWYPVTGRWTGVSIDRGSSDDSANVGTMTLTLENSDGAMSPWSTTFPNGARGYAAPGTLVRVSYGFSPGAGTVLPVFTGVVESWTVSTDPISGVSEVTIVAVETVSQLAGINDLALVAPVGSGETTTQRIQRLLDAAGWPYGLAVDATVTNQAHQSTLMAQDRLSECYLTATSAGAIFRSDRFGRAFLIGERSASGFTQTESAFADAGTLVLANDDDLIVNVLNLANTGGTVQAFTNDVSIGRHGRRTGGRSDLNLTPPSADLTFIASPELARSTFTFRPVAFDFDATSYPGYSLVYDMDLQQGVTLTTIQGVVFTNFRVVGLHHEIAPCAESGLTWTVTVSIAPSSTSTVTLP